MTVWEIHRVLDEYPDDAQVRLEVHYNNQEKADAVVMRIRRGNDVLASWRLMTNADDSVYAISPWLEYLGSDYLWEQNV